MTPRERVLYEETYKKGAAKVRTDLLPATLPYLSAGTTLVSIDIRKAGRVEIDGEELEFQDLHILVRPPKGSRR